MASFKKFELTNKGLELEYKAQLGKELKFTRFALGDGKLSATSIKELTSLNNEIISRDISKLKKDNTKVTLGFLLDNKEIVEGFYWREIGIFAEDPDTKEELLFMYSNAGETADYIPAISTANILEKRIDIDLFISDVENITAVIESSLVYASQADIETIETKIENEVTEIEQKLNNKADKKKVWNITIDTTWTGEEAPYTKTIALEGITANDDPNIYIKYSNDIETRAKEREAYSALSISTTTNGSITFQCDENKPEVAMNLVLEVVY